MREGERERARGGAEAEEEPNAGQDPRTPKITTQPAIKSQMLN